MRVLLTTTPGWGHVHPMVPLARALLERGHEVRWAASADVCARLRREGFEASAAGLSSEDSMAEFDRRYPEFATLQPPQRPDFMFPRLFGIVRAGAMLPDLVPVAEDCRPDVVVHDAAELAGPIVAARLGVPNVCHSFGPLLPEPRIAAAAREVAALWTASGLEPRPHGGSYDHLYVDVYPPSLQPAERPHVPATQLLRPGAFATSGDEPLPAWVAEPDAPPLVYVTFGTVFSNDAALSTVVEGLRDLGVRLVVTVGPRGDPDVLGTQPDNVHVARYIPQGRLLPHCAAVVSHAGSGTFLAALAAGLPQLCLPQAADQFLNAAACARSGSGLTVPPGPPSAGGVRDAAERLLADPAFRASARRLGAEIAAMPGPEEVADRLHARFG